jgi:hypothetical protein
MPKYSVLRYLELVILRTRNTTRVLDRPTGLISLRSGEHLPASYFISVGKVIAIVSFSALTCYL